MKRSLPVALALSALLAIVFSVPDATAARRATASATPSASAAPSAAATQPAPEIELGSEGRPLIVGTDIIDPFIMQAKTGTESASTSSRRHVRAPVCTTNFDARSTTPAGNIRRNTESTHSSP